MLSVPVVRCRSLVRRVPEPNPVASVEQLPFTHGFSLSSLYRLSVTSWKEKS
jgi:hypothetical protein